MTREGLINEVRRLVDQGQLPAALARCRELVETHPGDWSSVNLLGDLYARTGESASAAAQFRRAADHFREEGFLTKAAALYRKVLRLQLDDHALAGLADIAVAQGLLVEARRHLSELERRRRAAGDVGGAADCLARLERLAAGDRGAAHGEERRSIAAARVLAATAAPPPEAAVANGEVPPSVPASLPEDGSAGGGRGATAGPTPASVPSLESVFERLRQSAEEEGEAAAAAERFASAQARLERGDAGAAMADLEAAARAPILRFKAASQLGRLYLSRGALPEGVAWLERAAMAASPDAEEMAAALYDLAAGLEQMADTERALVAYRKLEAHAPGYRDARSRIAGLLARRQESGR